MYTKEMLAKYDYFNDADLTFVLDSLTGVISRQYILDFARKLVNEKVPFAMCMMDLDNFKYINDSYGHKAGDICLKTIAEGLVNSIGEDGLVGRFGGDEFIILYLKSNAYEDVHLLFEHLYGEGGAVRRFLYIENVRVFITATTGSASFPKDASDYNELFLKMDKALYRGKSKGRNCYIIYVHDKHKNIVIREKADGSAVERFNSAVRLFDIYKNENNIIKFTLDYLYSELHCSGAYFLTPEGKIYSNKDDNYKTTGYLIRPHIEMLLKDDKVFYETPLTKYKAEDPILRDFLESRAIQSILIVRLETFNLLNGFILIYENEITRVWQENEVTLVMYVSALLELQLSYRKKGI